MRNLILFLFCFGAFGTMAQANDWLLLLPKWEVDETKTITISIHEKVTRNDTLLNEKRDSTHEYLRVLTATTQGYTVEWLSERFRLDVFKDVPELQSAVDQVLGRADSLLMEVKVHPAGRLTGLRNWRDVQSVYFAIFDYVGKLLQQEGIEMTNEEITSMVGEMKHRIENRLEVERTALNPFETLFSGYNHVMHKDSVQIQELEIPISFAQRPVKATITTRIQELTESTATIVNETHVLEEDARTAINDYLKLQEAMGEAPFEPLQEGAFQFYEKSTYAYDRKSGWWTHVQFEAKTVINETVLEQWVRYKVKQD